MLTPSQLTTLKAAILADPVLSAKPNNSDGWFDTAALLNQVATPNYFVWKTSVSVSEIILNGFDWTRVDNLTVGKARIWEWMTQIGTINPSQANVRSGINACFSVQGADAANRQAIYDHSNRLATRAEKLFASGSGTTPTDQGIGPSTMTFEGNLSASDVEQARNLP